MKRKAERIPETITEQEFSEILKDKKLKGHHKLAFALGFYNCLRISEIVNLKQENIDWNRKLLLIKEAKGKKDRNIPISISIPKRLTDKYIPIKCGVRALEIIFKKKSKEILKRDLHFHSLRHSGATHKLNIQKWDSRALQQYLGHSSLNTTQIYLKVTPEDLIKLEWGE